MLQWSVSYQEKRVLNPTLKKCVYPMTKFGDDMVKFIDLGLRRLDSLTVGL